MIIPEQGHQDAGKSRQEKRLYVKEILLGHEMWKDARFWEQTLWQCVMEQVN